MRVNARMHRQIPYYRFGAHGEASVGTFTSRDRSYECPVELTLSAIGGKWKILILWNLRKRVRRYSELRRGLPRISHKMLAQQLRELEADGLVDRVVYPVVPPRVEYSLTEEGERLLPVLKRMRKWGLRYRVE